MNPQDFIRLAHSFYQKKGIDSSIERISTDAELINYFNSNQKLIEEKFKVAFVFICLNPLYWQYANEMITGARQFFLPGHKVDFLFWTDMPADTAKGKEQLTEAFRERNVALEDPSALLFLNNIVAGMEDIHKNPQVKIFPTESVAWPYPTLLRYNLFLQQEELLKEYDYIFYCDIDMKFVGLVSDEILGSGLTAAPHPGYYIRKELYPPYEPNIQSASYVKRPGKVMDEAGKPRFIPHYYAGGFQGGRSVKFIEAMKECRKIIEQDLNRGYVPIWNDESAWNKYLSENPPEIFLDPSYIYPDSLIKEYYEPIVWGRSFFPKLITLTKWFTVSKEGGQNVAQMIKK